MNTRWLVLALGLYGVAACGCRSDPHTDLYLEAMRAEYRMLEDELYALETDYKQALAELEQLRESAGTDDSRTDSRGGRPFRNEPRDPPADDGGPPGVDPGPLVPPNVEVPENGVRHEALPEPIGPPIADAQVNSTDAELAPPAVESSPLRRSVRVESNGRIATIAVVARDTHGADWDGQGGDDGLVVMVQPRDAADRFVARPAKISVVILDPTTRTRVARWDFSREQVAARMRRAADQPGIPLQCGWPGRPPANRQLAMFVRYYRPDGTHVQARHDLSINLAGQVSQRWTPRRNRRRAANTAPGDRIARQPQGPAEPPTPAAQTPQGASTDDVPGWSPDR